MLKDSKFIGYLVSLCPKFSLWIVDIFSYFLSVFYASSQISPSLLFESQDGSEKRKCITLLLHYYLFLLFYLNLLSDIFFFWVFNRDEPVIRMKTGASFVRFDPTRVTQLSWHPRFFFFFLDQRFYITC